MPQATTPFTVNRVDTTYEIDGENLRKCIQSCNVTQAEVANRAGYKGASRITHLIKRGRTRISGSYLEKLVNALKDCGANVEGFTDGESTQT